MAKRRALLPGSLLPGSRTTGRRPRMPRRAAPSGAARRRLPVPCRSPQIRLDRREGGRSRLPATHGRVDVRNSDATPYPVATSDQTAPT